MQAVFASSITDERLKILNVIKSVIVNELRNKLVSEHIDQWYRDNSTAVEEVARSGASFEEGVAPFQEKRKKERKKRKNWKKRKKERKNEENYE